MRAAWPKLVRLIRKVFGPFEYCLVWEIHADGYPHMHIATKGPYLPQRWLSAQWERLGIGRVVDIRRIDAKRGAARYMTKYMLKTVKHTRESLGLTRVVTASRGFFDRTLIKESQALTSDTETRHVLAGPGSIVQYLIQHHGYMLTGDVSGSVITLIPGPHACHPADALALLRALPRA